MNEVDEQSFSFPQLSISCQKWDEESLISELLPMCKFFLPALAILFIFLLQCKKLLFCAVVGMDVWIWYGCEIRF